jgi:hypothetical protein
MPPATAHHSARQGAFSRSTGLLYVPSVMTDILRKKDPFSKEDLSALGTTPPNSLLRNANERTIIFACPDMSVEELVAHFSDGTHLPQIKLDPRLHEQPWVQKKGDVSWVRVDPLNVTQHERAEGGYVPSARKLAVICLTLHYGLDAPGQWKLWRATSATRSAEDFSIYVRMMHGEIQFHQAGRRDVTIQQAVSVRSVRVRS